MGRSCWRSSLRPYQTIQPGEEGEDQSAQISLSTQGFRTRREESWGGGSPGLSPLSFLWDFSTGPRLCSEACLAKPGLGELHSLTIAQSPTSDLGHRASPPSALGGLTPPTSRVMRGSQGCGKRQEACLAPRKGAREGEDSPLLLPRAVQSPLSSLPTSSSGGNGAGAAHPKSPDHLGARWAEGVPEGVWLPRPQHPHPPRLGNRNNPTARRRPRGEAARHPSGRAGVPGWGPGAGGGGEEGGMRGGHRPRPTSSSSVTVFLQLCSRVVKLDVVGEL